MHWFPRPVGTFIGEFVVDLRVSYGEQCRVAEDFGFWDGETLWSVAKGFMHDGASFPWWLRWIPALVGLGLVRWFDVDGFTAAFWTVVLQALVGWPLAEVVREAGGVHDAGYKDGTQPKWKCDRAFFRVLWLRAYLDLSEKRIGLARAWLRLIQAAVWTTVVCVAGFGAWWGHRRRCAAAEGA